LRIFNDAFHGCFKDGTNGTRDCRYFAAVYLITQIILYATYALAYEGTDFASLSALLLVVLARLVATVRPYSEKFVLYNYVDTVMISALAVTYGSTVFYGLENGPRSTSAYKLVSQIICVTATLVPLIYITLVVLNWKSCSYS